MPLCTPIMGSVCTLDKWAIAYHGPILPNFSTFKTLIRQKLMSYILELFLSNFFSIVSHNAIPIANSIPVVAYMGVPLSIPNTIIMRTCKPANIIVTIIKVIKKCCVKEIFTLVSI